MLRLAATAEDAENRSSNGSPCSLDLSYSSSCFEGSNDSDGTSEVNDAHQGPSGSAVEPYMYEAEQSEGSPSSEEHSSAKKMKVDLVTQTGKQSYCSCKSSVFYVPVE